MLITFPHDLPFYTSSSPPSLSLCFLFLHNLLIYCYSFMLVFILFSTQSSFDRLDSPFACTIVWFNPTEAKKKQFHFLFISHSHWFGICMASMSKEEKKICIAIPLMIGHDRKCETWCNDTTTKIIWKKKHRKQR